MMSFGAGHIIFCRTMRSHLFFPVFVLVIFTGCKKKEPEITDQGNLIWKKEYPADIYYSSPALSADEKTLYIGTSTFLYGTPGTGNIFTALDPSTGNEKWRLSLGTSEVRSTASVAPDGSIYIGVEVRDQLSASYLRDELWHISASGQILWKYTVNPGTFVCDIGLSAPAVGADGTVYIGGDRLYAVRPDGTLRWTAFTPMFDAFRNAPVIGDDGTIYFAFHNVPLTALDSETGAVIWSCTLGVNEHCFASPAISSDGTICVATHPGIIYAVSKDGQLKWTFNLASAGFSGTLRSSPAIGRDGSVYFGINHGSPCSAFFALKSDGTLKWVFEPTDLPPDTDPTHFDIYSSPALGTDSLVYFGQEFGRVYALRLSDGSMVSMEEVKSGITWSSPAIDKNGVLYINDLDGRLYAFQTKSKGIDTLAPWPKYRYDNQNSGRRNSAGK